MVSRSLPDGKPATHTELAALGLLAWQGERSGYELHKLAGRTVGFFWAPARSQLYAVLKRLDAAGLVSGRHIEQADRPDKRLFRITEAGMVALRSWLAVVEPIEPEDNDPLLLKLFFGGFGDPESSRRQLLDYRGRVEERLAAYLEIERTFDDEPDVAALHRLLTVRMGIALMQANRAWVDDALTALAAGAPAPLPGPT